MFQTLIAARPEIADQVAEVLAARREALESARGQRAATSRAEVQADLLRFNAVVSLYKALGGGWEKQASLAKAVNVSELRQKGSSSFDKFVREIQRLTHAGNSEAP